MKEDFEDMDLSGLRIYDFHDVHTRYDILIPIIGQRFILNPKLNLSTLGLSPMAMTIAVAAQKYGFVVDDSSGSVSIRLPDPTTYTVAGLPNPYTSGPGVGGVGNQGLYEGQSSSTIMKNFPWSQLEALPFNYGEPGGG